MLCGQRIIEDLTIGFAKCRVDYHRIHLIDAMLLAIVDIEF